MQHTSLLLHSYVKAEEHSPSSAISAGAKEAIINVIFCYFGICVAIVVLPKFLQ